MGERGEGEHWKGLKRPFTKMRLIVTYEDTVRFYHRTFYYIDVSG